MSELKKPDAKVDITGLKCPVPLIMLRRTVMKAKKEDIIEFTGTSEEEISRKEIVMAVNNLKQDLILNEDLPSSDRWKIIIRKK
ncbi:MAG: sulfurtransferase TusA family protein [Candidatus Hodarchaeales archaeon]